MVLVVCLSVGFKGGFVLGRLRLFVCVRVQGARIESVPLKRLVRLSGYRKKRWEFKDGWLILEAF